MNIVRRSAAVAGLAALVWLAASAQAGAVGVTLIQQSDGTVKTYANVVMTLSGGTLTLRSADGRGTLQIRTGACSFVKSIRYCLPYAARLTQGKRSHAIALAYGSVFFNFTNSEQNLPHSSGGLAPHTVLLLLKTARGTYVTAKGRLDEVRS
jgi:hypothetical protein